MTKSHVLGERCITRWRYLWNLNIPILGIQNLYYIFPHDTHHVISKSKPMPPKQSWRMPLSSSSCHDYIVVVLCVFDFASWYDNQSSVTLNQKRFQKKSRVAPWCGKGKNWKDVWLTDDLRVFDYVLLTDINIPFGISCKHSQK